LYLQGCRLSRFSKCLLKLSLYPEIIFLFLLSPQEIFLYCKTKCHIEQEKEIIVIDDFSTDGTREILKQDIEAKVSKILYHEKNKGKGAAINTGLAEATGDMLIIQDADLEYNPDEYHLLIDPIVKGHADVVYGSRFLSGSQHRVLYFWHSIGNKVLTLLSNMMTNLNLTDMETCYKIFKRDVYTRLIIKEKRFGIEPEMTAKIAKMHAVIYEVGISYFGRTYDEGKKINWKDGVRAIWCIFKYNLFAKVTPLDK